MYIIMYICTFVLYIIYLQRKVIPIYEKIQITNSHTLMGISNLNISKFKLYKRCV